MKRSKLILSLAALPLVAAMAASPALACDSCCKHKHTKHEHQDKHEHVTAEMDIVDTAVAAGSFKTLAAALGAADLVGALKGDGPFTVFAPTDEAFAALPEGTVESLLKPENKAKLQAVLTYHVVPGRVYAADAIKAGQAKTVQGSKVTIKADDGKVTVDGANVVAADIDTTNGVVHVIDAVILPKD